MGVVQIDNYPWCLFQNEIFARIIFIAFMETLIVCEQFHLLYLPPSESLYVFHKCMYKHTYWCKTFSFRSIVPPIGKSKLQTDPFACLSFQEFYVRQFHALFTDFITQMPLKVMLEKYFHLIHE